MPGRNAGGVPGALRRRVVQSTIVYHTRGGIGRLKREREREKNKNCEPIK